MPAFIRRRLCLAALALAAAVCLVLPASAQRPPVPHREKVTVTLNRNNIYFLDGRRIRENQIEPLLAARVRKNPNIVAVIRCDKSQPFGHVMHLMDSVKQAGVQSFLFAVPPTMPHHAHSRH